MIDMKFRKLKHCLAVVLALFLLGGSVTAIAAENSTVDFSRTGVISITLKTKDTAVSGAELTIYYVADAESEESNLSFSFTDEFTDFGGIPEQLENTAEIRRLTEFVEKNGIFGLTAVTDSSGHAVFNDLPLGIYLVVQTGSAEGFSDCSPFLVTLPTEEGGAWVYEIDATPKTDVEQLIDLSVKKVWNDGGDTSSRPSSITVNLYKDSALVDTVILNSDNSWSYDWTGLEKSDGYSISEVDVTGYAATYSQSGYTFTITNTPKLVQTGQLNWPIPLLAGCGLALFAIGWGLVFLMRKKDA